MEWIESIKKMFSTQVRGPDGYYHYNGTDVLVAFATVMIVFLIFGQTMSWLAHRNEKTYRPIRKRTVCDAHREVIDELTKRDSNDPLIKKLEKASNATRKISNELQEYKDICGPVWDD